MMTMDDIYNNAQRAVYARCAKQKRIIQQYEEQTPVDIDYIVGCVGLTFAAVLTFICIIL